jgi:hypothetical protein
VRVPHLIRFRNARYLQRRSSWASAEDAIVKKKVGITICIVLVAVIVLAGLRATALRKSKAEADERGRASREAAEAACATHRTEESIKFWSEMCFQECVQKSSYDSCSGGFNYRACGERKSENQFRACVFNHTPAP